MTLRPRLGRWEGGFEATARIGFGDGCQEDTPVRGSIGSEKKAIVAAYFFSAVEWEEKAVDGLPSDMRIVSLHPQPTSYGPAG